MRNRQAGLLALVAAGTLSCADQSPLSPTAAVLSETRAASGSGVTAAANAPPNLVVRTTPAADYSTDPPTIRVTKEGLNVFFGLCQSSDPDGDSMNWQFNFGDARQPAWNADGTFNPDHEHECRVDHQYRTGTWTATVTVTDKHLGDQGRNGGVTSMARKSQSFTIVANVERGEPDCETGFSVNTGFEGFENETFVGDASIPGVSLFGPAFILDSSLEEGVPPPFSGNVVFGFGFGPPDPEFGFGFGGLKQTLRQMSSRAHRSRAAMLIPPSEALEMTFESDQVSYRFDGAALGAGFVVKGYDAAGVLVFTHTFPGPDECSCDIIPMVVSGAGRFRKLEVTTTVPTLYIIDNLSTQAACK